MSTMRDHVTSSFHRTMGMSHDVAARGVQGKRDGNSGARLQSTGPWATSPNDHRAIRFWRHATTRNTREHANQVAMGQRMRRSHHAYGTKDASHHAPVHAAHTKHQAWFRSTDLWVMSPTR